MKSLYFTSKEIEPQAEDLLTMIGQKDRRTPEWQNPALLVLDMQQYFLRGDSHAFIPSAPAIVPGILQLINGFKRADFPVIFTKHINSEADAGNMSTWWRDMITADQQLAELVEQFQPVAHDVVIKTQYDAFFGTDLQQRLDFHQVTDVIVTGVMTHLCCETTARSAFVSGYRVWFPVDGTATYNIDFHIGSLRNLAHGFARIPLMKDLIRIAGSK